MKVTVLGCSLVALFLLGGCAGGNGDNTASSQQSTTAITSNEVTASTSSINEALQSTTTEETPSDIQASSAVEEQPVVADLDIEAINNGDLTTLVGTWMNGNGDVLVINADGTTNGNYTIHSVPDSDKTSKIPYANLSDGTVGAALGLYKIGFENPDGDYSDTTAPRLTIAQQGGAYSAEGYYYRQ